MKYSILSVRDASKYVPRDQLTKFLEHLVEVEMYIEEGRKKDGKKPSNNYVIINQDEPYIHEIIDVMKRNGHWEEE
ncbi:hypothetical protein HF695_10800 [Bacillus safensis]|uniref:hypothetical protein n=1 Tax=Bacillus safensis TaxID=561879 RepID=UPI001BAAD374|nr:hypothetical protein [Bacillus safensis]MBR0602809.1 hypothetical protein [Bacillus safensis]